jgi:hypothetical protein
MDRSDVIVSIGYDGTLNNEFVFDLTIDNQSDSTIIFDPTRAYLFCYDTNSTLTADALYSANHPDSVVNSLSSEIDSLDKNVKANTFFSVLLGIAYISAEIAMAGSDAPPVSRELLRAGHFTSQVLLDEKRFQDIEDIENLSYARCRVDEDIMRETVVEPGRYHTGKLHFTIPKSPYYKIYIPVNENIYSFRFKTSQNN